MSRIPQTSSSRVPRSPNKLAVPTPGTPRAKTPTRITGSVASPRIQTKSTPSKAAPARRPSPEKEPPAPKPAVSLRDAIALKRAEAKKALAANKHTIGPSDSLEDVNPLAWDKPVVEQADDLGRWSLRETIERARTSGNINLSSRDLPCLPSALFEIHLGITTAPLKSVPDEPKLPPVDETAPRRKAGKEPTWFDAQDLEFLKAWNNQIVEIHPEIRLFGSLKTVDLHNNNLTVLPETFADLTALVTLDLSHNTLESLPENFFTLPNLSIINLSHNQLTSLPFQHAFVPENMQRLRARNPDDAFAPEVYRADVPLPALKSMDVSFNKISASSIDENFPAMIQKLDLSSNPLRDGFRNLIRVLSRLAQLKELRCSKSEIGNDALSINLFPNEPNAYAKLQILDLGETTVTEEFARIGFGGLSKELNFYDTADDPPEGVIKVSVGKRLMKEAWEIEVEKRGQRKAAPRAPTSTVDDFGFGSSSTPKEVIKESWELEAEQGLLTEGGRRRARAAAAAAAKAEAAVSAPDVPKPPVKESWEIQADEGLSAGAQRLRRAKAAEAAAQAAAIDTTEKAPATNGNTSSLANSKYYSAATLTLTLPSSSPLANKNALHTRSFSVASPAFGKSEPSDLTIPTPTLPLAFIISQPIAHTLKVLELNNRRLDHSFSLPPTTPDGFLPNLEELSLEGCGLGDQIATSYADQPRTNEPIIPLLTKLFPTLASLNLTYNMLTSAALNTDALTGMILGKTRPLKHLRLRGNKITELSGFQGLAEGFKGNREVLNWKMEELDLRDNEIGRLPAELGLMPLDVFLVDGNIFRAPARRIWEREGTKGLLSWLRGRLE